MALELDTKSLFKTHFGCWRLLGMLPPQRLRPLYWLYSLLVNVLVTVGYPLHLMLGLFTSTSLYAVIQNLAINLTCTVCAMKTCAIWWRFEEVDVIFDIVRRQDERMRSDEELKYMKRMVYPTIRGIIILFYILCSSVALTGETAILFNGLRGDGDWRLMYQAYFPFDPFGSTLNYAVAHVYQFVGVSYIILQNLVNDTFAGAHLALLGGQVHLLGMRVARIGHDRKKTRAENNQDLLACIHDHKDLLEYRSKLEHVISVYMFFQILFSSMNMCVVLVFMILFVQDPFTLAYYLSYFLGMVAEILPSCYYGTILEEEFQHLAYALFSCNWSEQDLEFKKNLRIFAEQASRRIYVTAWLFRINNNSFLTACKNAYSLFALIMNINHIPKAKATAIADTPELKRIAENTKIQSNVKYHEDFEKAKGKFTQVADDPETLRIKQNTKHISNVAYHGDLEKKAAMEKQRGAAEASDSTKDESEYFSEQLAAEQFAQQYAPQSHASHSPLPPQQLSPRLPMAQQPPQQQQAQPQQQTQPQQQHQYHYTTPQQQQQTMPPPNIQHQQHNTAHVVPSNQAGTTQVYQQNNSRQAQAQAQPPPQHQHPYATSHLQQQQFIQHEQQQQQQYQHYQQPQMLRQPQSQQQQHQHQQQLQQQQLKQSSHLYPSSSSSSTAANLQQQQQQQQQQQLASQYQQPNNSYNQLRSAILQSSHHPTGALIAGDPSMPLTPASIPTAASASYNSTYDQYDNTTNYPATNRATSQAQIYQQQQHHNNNNLNNSTNNNNAGLVSVQSYQTAKGSAATTPNYGGGGGGGSSGPSTATAQQQLFPNQTYNNYQTSTLSSSASTNPSLMAGGAGGGGSGTLNGGQQPSSQLQQQPSSQQTNHHLHHHHNSNGGAVINGSIGKIADYDPLSDGPRPLPNTARASTTLIYSSDSRGNVNNSYAKRIGSVADIDPVNGIYGSLTAEQQQQQQQHMSNHNLQQQQYYQQMPVMQQQHQQQPHQQQQNHQSHHSLQQQKQAKQNLRIYRALYDYEAQDVDEVSFREGDIIFEVESIDSGWMTGRVERTGKTGMLPANYVEQAVI